MCFVSELNFVVLFSEVDAQGSVLGDGCEVPPIRTILQRIHGALVVMQLLNHLPCPKSRQLVLQVPDHDECRLAAETVATGCYHSPAHCQRQQFVRVAVQLVHFRP